MNGSPGLNPPELKKKSASGLDWKSKRRRTGDGPKKDLIAPLWSADKKATLNALARYLEVHDVRQGAAWEG